MKNKLAIILAVTLLSSCAIHNPKHRTVFVVTTIGITKNNTMAIYTAKEHPAAKFKDRVVQFFDEKHRYEVGDTIQFFKTY